MKPYVHVRGELWARVTRALTYDLVDLGEERDGRIEAMFGLWLAGTFVPIAPASGPDASS